MDLVPFTPKQADLLALARTHRLTIQEGAVRSSKTVVSLFAWMDLLLNGPPGLLLMVGVTVDSLRRNVLLPLQEMLGPDLVQLRKNEGVILGRSVEFMGAPNQGAESRLVGLSLAGAYVDETTKIPQAFFQQLGARLSVKGARLITSTNPAAPNHWLLTDFLERARTVHNQDGTITDRAARVWLDRAGAKHWADSDGVELLDLLRSRWVLPDNSSLDPQYLASIIAENRGVFYKRYILGEWVAAEGSVYDMLDGEPGLCRYPDADCLHGRHVVTDRHLPVDAAGKVIYRDLSLAIDYGTKNATSAVLGGTVRMLDGTERLIVLRTWHYSGRDSHKSLSPEQLSKRMREWLDGGADGLVAPGAIRLVRPPVVDPSATGLRVQMEYDGWGSVKTAQNSVQEGIRVTMSLLGSDRLRFHDSIPKAAMNQLIGYAYDEGAQERGIEQPLKVNDDFPDTLRYWVRMMNPIWRDWLRYIPSDDS